MSFIPDLRANIKITVRNLKGDEDTLHVAVGVNAETVKNLLTQSGMVTKQEDNVIVLIEHIEHNENNENNESAFTVLQDDYKFEKPYYNLTVQTSDRIQFKCDLYELIGFRRALSRKRDKTATDQLYMQNINAAIQDLDCQRIRTTIRELGNRELNELENYQLSYLALCLRQISTKTPEHEQKIQSIETILDERDCQKIRTTIRELNNRPLNELDDYDLSSLGRCLCQIVNKKPEHEQKIQSIELMIKERNIAKNLQKIEDFGSRSLTELDNFELILFKRCLHKTLDSQKIHTIETILEERQVGENQRIIEEFYNLQ